MRYPALEVSSRTSDELVRIERENDNPPIGMKSQAALSRKTDYSARPLKAWTNLLDFGPSVTEPPENEVSEREVLRF
jgi:hypothetical protein